MEQLPWTDFKYEQNLRKALGLIFYFTDHENVNWLNKFIEWRN